MATSVRAIYKQGQLQLLDPINLTDGEQVEVMIITEIDPFKEAFADILTKPLPSDYDEIADRNASLEALKHLLVKPLPSDDVMDKADEESIMEEIREAFKGQPPLSEDIIRERQEGP